MQDDLERSADSTGASSAHPPAPVRLELLDVPGAIAAAEKAAGSRVFSDVTDEGALAQAFPEACALADRGERAAIVAPAERLASMRDALRKVAASRRGMVVHALAGHGAEELGALADVGWGVLCASGPEDSFDLTLIARRAAEDSGVPFVIVHALGRPQHAAGRAVAMVGLPQDRAIQAFVGQPTPSRTRGDGARTTAGDRAFAERVPFALGAALREYGNVSGRRHDTFDKIPLGETPLVLIGCGPVGDALFCATHELRARGYDVGAIHITSLRPFPGPRLVKALARALAIAILEPVDEPLAPGSLLARDVKAAFTDALTWMPGFPGIGRIPKLFVGATGPTFDVADLASVCENMLADERGRRAFSFVDAESSLPRVRGAETTKAEREVALRLVVDDPAAAESVLGTVAAALVKGVGLRTQCIVTATLPGVGPVLDLVAWRDHARGGMARRAPRVVLATPRGIASSGATVSLADGAVLAVLGGDGAAALPEAARTAVRERSARVLPLGVDDAASPTKLAAAAAGAALAAAARALRSTLEASTVARTVVEITGDAGAEETARRAFESMRDALAVGDAAAKELDGGKPPYVS